MVTLCISQPGSPVASKLAYHDCGPEFKSWCQWSTCGGPDWDFWGFSWSSSIFPFSFHQHYPLFSSVSHFRVIHILLSSPIKKPASRHPVRTMDLAHCRQVYISSSCIWSQTFGHIKCETLGHGGGAANCSGPGSCRYYFDGNMDKWVLIDVDLLVAG